MSYSVITMNKLNQRLTFIKNHHSEKRGKNNHNIMYAEYKCECGNVCVKRKSDVTRDQIKSCGQCNKHGMTKTRFYRIWMAVRTRINNPNVINYHLYGGRGITICERWNKFDNFKDDLFESYNQHVNKHGIKDTTIDRIDVNGVYEPGNVRWATCREQANNQRRIKRHYYKGTMMTIPEISEITGIPSATLYDRERYGRDLINYKRAYKRAYGDVDSIEPNKKGKLVPTKCCNISLTKGVK